MSLTGDIIQGFRELAPDPSQTLQPPTFTATVDLTSYPPPGGGLGFSFGDGTIVYVKATQLTPWGETASLAEQTVAGTFQHQAHAHVRVFQLSQILGADQPGVRVWQ